MLIAARGTCGQGTEFKWGRSRWVYYFRRSWTLQELITPEDLTFFDSGWVKIGTRAELSSEVSKITGICPAVFNGEHISGLSVGAPQAMISNHPCNISNKKGYFREVLVNAASLMHFIPINFAFYRLVTERQGLHPIVLCLIIAECAICSGPDEGAA